MDNHTQPELDFTGALSPVPTVERVNRDTPEFVKTTTTTFRDVAFTFRGVTYTVPRNAMDDLEVLEALEEDKFITVIRKTIGDAQWKTFKDTSRTADGRLPLTESGFEEFLDAMMRALDPTTAS